jgi:AAA+ ATPase superfamily predicted ATPase
MKRKGVNTIIISPRRWGKTSLVLKASNELSDKNIKVVNIDIFACRSATEFYQTFATEIIKQTSNKREEWIENVKRFLSNLSPKITFGSDPTTEFSLSLDFSNKQFNEEILTLPQKIAKDMAAKNIC